MLILLNRAWKLINTTLHGWRLPLVVVVIVFATSWLGLWLVEPIDNEITRPANYWWFLVTVATVGYGDFEVRDHTVILGYLAGRTERRAERGGDAPAGAMRLGQGSGSGAGGSGAGAGPGSGVVLGTGWARR